jgi:CRP-like cAMP-binding protein
VADNFQAEITKQLIAWYRQDPSRDTARRRSTGRGGWHETVVGQPVVNLPVKVQKRLLEAVRKTDLFHLTDAHLLTLVKNMTAAKFAAGDVMMKENEEGRVFIIVDNGRCDVHVRCCGDPEKDKDGNYNHGPCVASKGPDEFFGEVSLLYNCKRTATVIAHTDVSCFLLDRENFKSLLLRQSLVEKYRLEELVESVDMFRDVLTKYDKVSLAANGEEVMYEDGDSIVNASSKLESIFIVDEGVVVQRRPGEDSTVVDEQSKGTVIGQLCYQTGWPLTHNYFAQGPCRILVLTYEQLEPVKHKLKTYSRMQRKQRGITDTDVLHLVRFVYSMEYFH